MGWSVTTLQDAVTKKGNTIELENDIVVTSMLQIAEGVTIDGTKGKLIADDSLNANTLIEIKKNNVTITNLTIENYLNTAIACYGTTGTTTLNNITLKGRGNVDKDVQSKVGLEIAQNSNVNIQSIKTSNNTQAGIRVKGSSTLNMLGGNTHVNDTNQLVVVVGSDNKLTDQAKQYKEVGKDDRGNILYGKKVTDFATLQDAVTKKGNKIELENEYIQYR